MKLYCLGGGGEAVEQAADGGVGQLVGALRGSFAGLLDMRSCGRADLPVWRHWPQAGRPLCRGRRG